MKIPFLKQGVMTHLCPFSDKDPGGLLLLPEKGDLADLHISEVLAVMSTLLSVAAREVTGGCSLSSLPHAFRSTRYSCHCASPLSPHLQYECNFVPVTVTKEHKGFPAASAPNQPAPANE